MSDRRWIGARQLQEDALRLAARVLASGWQPQLLIGLWRGGAPVAIAMHEALVWHGLDCAHAPLATSLYTGIDARAPQLRIEGLEALAPRLAGSARVLLVDDVFDTGRTVAGVREAIAGVAPGADTRIATVWWKPARNTTALRPDWHLHETDAWLVFPHELQGLPIEEIRAARGVRFAQALLGED